MSNLFHNLRSVTGKRTRKGRENPIVVRTLLGIDQRKGQLSLPQSHIHTSYHQMFSGNFQ